MLFILLGVSFSCHYLLYSQIRSVKKVDYKYESNNMPQLLENDEDENEENLSKRMDNLEFINDDEEYIGTGFYRILFSRLRFFS